jgi:hypothetical protein
MARFLTIVPVLALFGLLATAVAVPLEAHTTNIVTADKYGKVLDKYEDVHSTKSSYKQSAGAASDSLTVPAPNARKTCCMSAKAPLPPCHMQSHSQHAPINTRSGRRSLPFAFVR